MARNVHIDHYNKTKYFIQDYDDPNKANLDQREALEVMEKKQRYEVLKEALDLLSVEQREILELSRFQDLKYDEISQITGASVGAVKVKVHRAIKKLKELYFELA